MGHRQYLTINQKAAIAVYAKTSDLTIVETYDDAGQRGLTVSTGARAPTHRSTRAECSVLLTDAERHVLLITETRHFVSFLKYAYFAYTHNISHVQ